MIDTQRLFKIKEVEDILSLSKSALYREINAGNLKAVHVGKAIRITNDEIIRYVASLSDGK